MDRLARRPEAALFAMALGAYAYFFQGGGWNQNSRFNLVRSIVEQHTIVVDDYVHNTGDIAMRDGHHYCDKAPGVSILAVPVYAAVHPFAGGQRPRGRLVNAGAYLATVWAVSLPVGAGGGDALPAGADDRRAARGRGRGRRSRTRSGPWPSPTRRCSTATSSRRRC